MRRTLSHLLARLSGAIARRWLIGAVAAAEVSSALAVDCVDDPVQPIRLVRAVGTIDPMSIHQIVRSWEHVTPPFLVHLDIRDARITDALTMSRLETALDRLELRHIDVRIVGIDPQHPAIAS